MHSKINIGEILTTTWQIFWQHKVLWLFGVLATCGVSLYISASQGLAVGIMSLAGTQPGQVPGFLKPGASLASYVTGLTIAIVLLVALMLVFYYFSVLGRAALIKGIGQAEAGALKLHWGELWSQSRGYFWRLVWLDSIVLLPATVWMLIVTGALVVTALVAGHPTEPQYTDPQVLVNAVIGFILCGMCFFILGSVVLGLVAEMAYSALVLEDLGAWASLKRGWQVFKNGWVNIGVFYLLLSFLAGIVNTILMTPAEALAQAAALGALGRNPGTFLMLGGAVFAISLPLSVVTFGLILVFSQSTRTLLYLRLTK